MRIVPALSLAGALLATGIATPALAGPPFVTDDPEPTDLHKWEIYNFALGTIENGTAAADMGVDLNYGGFKDVQLTAVLPLHVETGAPLDTGDVELAAKFKFLHQRPGTPSLDVTFFPRVFLPTGRGSRHTQLLLPVWAERDWGKWSLFGGGGYTINPGAGNRDYAIWGGVLNRQMRSGWQLGLEYYGQGPATLGDHPTHGLNLGTTIHLHGPFSLLGSFGQGLNRRQTIFYTALKLDL